MRVALVGDRLISPFTFHPIRTMQAIQMPRGYALSIKANLYGNGGDIQWQLFEARPYGPALIAETAVGGDRAELEALKRALEKALNV